MPKTLVLEKPEGEEKPKVAPLAKGQRPYRVVVTTDGLIITEWMWRPEDGVVFRTHWKEVKKQFLDKGKTSAYFLQGVRAVYSLLKDGSFLVPFAKTPVSITINDRKYVFDDIYPYAKYVVQAKSTSDRQKVIDRYDYVGLGWRKNISLVDGFEVDLTVSLIVDPDENGGKWEIIASNPKTKRKYEVWQTYNQGKNIIQIQLDENRLLA